jgi:SAM-dependent methyltransferase
MNATPQEHYERLLAENYVWMMGDFDARVRAQRALLERVVPAAREGALAVDLGSGPGYQSIAIADMGYRVVAVDTSARLLVELTSRCVDRTIVPVLGDLVAFDEFVTETLSVATCMGDTLTHLASVEAVRRLLARLAARMRKGGVIVFTWRDLSQPLEGVDRIIPVRADDSGVMTCFLEYQPERVIVHDVISRRTAEGWVTHRSAYAKLRLAHDDVARWIEEAGFRVTHDDRAPFSTLAAVAR